MSDVDDMEREREDPEEENDDPESEEEECSCAHCGQKFGTEDQDCVLHTGLSCLR